MVFFSSDLVLNVFCSIGTRYLLGGGALLLDFLCFIGTNLLGGEASGLTFSCSIGTRNLFGGGLGGSLGGVLHIFRFLFKPLANVRANDGSRFVADRDERPFVSDSAREATWGSAVFSNMRC